MYNVIYDVHNYNQSNVEPDLLMTSMDDDFHEGSHPIWINITNTTDYSDIIDNISARIDYTYIKKFYRNRSLENDVVHYFLIGMYCLLILVGSLGNILVITAVARNPAMRTVRNIFIINLGISDLLLCLITMPLTLAEVLSQYWPFGKSAILCKLFGTLQALSIFVSSITITAIALDRHQVWTN